MSSCQLLPQAKVSLEHITCHINKRHNGDNKRPLVVGLAGVTGMGKTSLSHTLGYVLEQDHDLQTTVVPLDEHVLGHSLVDLLATLNSSIQSEDYSVIFVEGSLMGYKALPPTHRIWTQLLEQPTNESYQSLQKFNEALGILETKLYPLIDVFIQLSANQLDDWRLSLGSQFSVHQLYLERLDKSGFFDGGVVSSGVTARNGMDTGRHLVLYLDKDRKLVQQRRIMDGLISDKDQNSNGSHYVPTSHSIKRVAGAIRDHRRTWLMSPIIRQQRKYLIATLNPRVLISFAMMSLLGLLGYSRRLSFILDLFNKIQHFVL